MIELWHRFATSEWVWYTSQDATAIFLAFVAAWAWVRAFGLPWRRRRRTAANQRAEPKLILTDAGGTPVVSELSFTAATGDVSPAQTFRVVNGDGLVTYDDAPGPRVGIVNPGSADSVKERAWRERWWEAKATGNGTGAWKIITPWIPIGEGAELALPPLEDAEYHEIRLRLNAPGTAPGGPVHMAVYGRWSGVSEPAGWNGPRAEWGVRNILLDPHYSFRKKQSNAKD